MILPDVNLLLYAVDAAAPRHAQAREWLEDALSGTEEVGFAWAVLLAFVRISTNPAAFEAPLGVAGNLTSDAHLAALAIEHGADLCSSDTDFARFERLRWRDPIS